MVGTTAIPIPSEAVMAFSGFMADFGKFSAFPAVALGTLGNFCGFTILYFVGKKISHFIYENRVMGILVGKKNIDIAKKWIEKKGLITVFVVAMLPLFRAILGLPAGILKINYKKFIIVATSGALLWNSLWFYLGYVLGENWGVAEKYVRSFSLFIILIAVFLVGFYLKYKFSSKKSTS
jgi:membrane protein DedA with SNARE-associated domain